MSIFISCEQKSSWALEHLVSKLEDSLGIDIEMSSTLTDGIKSEVELTSLDEFAIPTNTLQQLRIRLDELENS